MSNFAVIFDMDGVLVDSNEAHFEAFRQIGRDLGTPFTRDHLHQIFGMHNNQIFPLWLGTDLSPERVSELALRKEAIYREIAQDHLAAVPGAVELVKELKQAGISLAVGSSGPRANVEMAIKRLDLADYFGVLVTGDDVFHGKPAPDIFLKASQKLGFVPERCLVIEDAVQGVQAARTAGMRVVAITTSRPASDLALADRVIGSFKSINFERICELMNNL